MLRPCFAAPLILIASYAAAQTTPSNTSNRPQPNPSTQPGIPADPTAMESAGMAGAPPAFVPAQSEVMPPRPRGPVRISGGVMAGNVLTKVNPEYPPDARAAGVQGTVVLSATIGKDGAVQDLTVVSGPPTLASAAGDAVRQWTYKPYLLNGQPTEVRTTITVNFNLAAPPPMPPQ